VNAAPIELYPRTPWELRLFDRVPLPAFWVGTAIGLGVFACFLAYTAAFGEEIGSLGAVKLAHGWAAELLQDLFFGFTLAVEAASVRGALRDLELLRPSLEPELRDREALRRVALRYQPVPLLVAGLLVGAGSALATVLNSNLWIGGRMPGWTHPAVLWLGARNFLNWAIVARAMLLELMLGSAFSRLGEALGSVDLFDHARFEPFGRRAMRNVSLWLLLIAFLSLNFAGRGWAIPSLMALGMVFLGGFALAAFMIPLLGPHRRLRAAKREELACVRAAVRAARDRALIPDAERSGSGHLGDLLAYEARVAEVGEWPIQTSTVARFAFFLALGLGSWVGAGLVQHGIEAALR
jgi:hypothetical protein